MIGQAYVLYFIILPAIFGLLGFMWLLWQVYVNVFSCQCYDCKTHRIYGGDFKKCKDGGFKGGCCEHARTTNHL
ncbi:MULTISPECIES: hypothetical protein [Acinetobacter]|jgi:hypothetical protein|uniref:hypothetical protein n=1 Tax=Acinetobacter TaxID=469 RepID=UPI000E2BC155|nr:MULTISPECIES: hypothetical protein [Acinetobacter]MDB0280420.1 hypothetical protein [Acinetobacter seifertii]MDS7927598.1 hypothetical protein [Acinetobacter sp. V115_6]RDJ56803.1 hypothetical protein AB719_13795 [Acinetobacter baumannii]